MVTDIEIDREKFRRYKEYCEDDENQPDVSVIIPAYDDPDGVRQTVEALATSGYDSVEIIVVIEPSTGETVGVARELERQFGFVEVLVDSRYDTPGVARNVGIDVATGSLVVFVDANVVPEPEFLWKVSFVLDNSNVEYLGMPVTIGFEEADSVAGWYDQHVRYPVEFYIKAAKFAPTCALAVDESVVEELKFESRLVAAEDVLFGKLAYAKGFNFGYCPEIQVTHPTRTSLSEIVRVGEKTGRGFYQTYHHLPVTLFESKPRTLTLNAYTPRSVDYLRRICREWDQMMPHQKFLIMALAYVEVLARTVGYVKQSVTERTTRE